MRLSFLGAAKSVTGSMHLLEIHGKKILIDCGLQLGRDEIDNAYLPFNAHKIDIVIITHSHLDHSGRLPLLVRQGFRGRIYATGMTCKLLGIMLRDSAHIQECDAEWLNRKGKRAGKLLAEPLYTMPDAELATQLLIPMSYGERREILSGVELRFSDAGHMLGSAFAEVWVTEEGEQRKIVFSGDIGNADQPIIRDPSPIDTADYVVMESTYGNKLHDTPTNYTLELADFIESTFKAGGNVIIPSFAVGRTQELLYCIREIKQNGLVKGFGNFPVYVDSPLAREATRIFAGDLTGYMDQDAIELVTRGSKIFQFPGLRLCESVAESKQLNLDRTPKVIISASGMCEAGRIRHHLKHNLWRKECTVIFVGHQPHGLLGRLLLDGLESVKLFGEEIVVKARIISLQGLSSHADKAGLIKWVENFKPKPRHVFVVHGDKDVAPLFSETLRDLGHKSHAPDYKEIYDLLGDNIETYGEPLSRRQPSPYESTAYKKLALVGQQLTDVIARNKGGANKDLGHFTDQLRALIDKWDR